MNVQSLIPVRETARSAELAGAQDGMSWAKAMRSVVDAAVSGVHAIDFTGITLATVSWLREAILELVKYASVTRPDVLLIAANASHLVIEEMGIALEARKSVLILADVSPSMVATKPRLIGWLDHALDESLRAIVGIPECDASYLVKALPQLGLPAANNRLSALESKGVLTSERRGRSRIYRPILEGLSYGN